MLAFDLDIHKGDFHLQACGELLSTGIIGLIGRSGAGKSTLLRGLAGLEKHCRGRVQFGGVDWLDSARAVNVPLHLRSISMVFQQPSLLPHLTVLQNLQYAWRRVPQGQRRISLEDAIDQLRLSSLAGRYPRQLSGGEAQRVAIARAICANPTLLLMDEPLASVDVEGRQEILGLLDDLRQQLTMPMIYVSHALDEVARLSDQLILLEKGRLRASGSTQSMLTRFDLPLAHAPDAEALLDARVTGYDSRHEISQLRTPLGVFQVAHKLEPGCEHRLRIKARDVSVTLSRAGDSSILNILPVTVVEITADESGQCLLKLESGASVILARLTRQSVSRLGLQAGMNVFAQIKSVALD